MRSPKQPRKPGPEQPRPTRPLTPEEQEDARILAHLEQSGGAFAAGQPWHVDEPVQQPQRPAPDEWKTFGLLAAVPGDTHETFDAALVDSSNYLWSHKPPNGAESPHAVEYGSTIYKTPEGKYTYTPPYTDGQRGSVRYRVEGVPKGGTVEGFTHNHPLILSNDPSGSPVRHMFTNKNNLMGAPGDMEAADQHGKPVGMITLSPFPEQGSSGKVIKKYTPQRGAPGTVTQYDEKTGKFGPETTLARPPRTAPEMTGRGKGTDVYEMPDGSRREVPHGAPPPPWPPEEKKDKTKNDERDRQGGENRRGAEITRALT